MPVIFACSTYEQMEHKSGDYVSADVWNGYDSDVSDMSIYVAVDNTKYTRVSGTTYTEGWLHCYYQIDYQANINVNQPILGFYNSANDVMVAGIFIGTRNSNVSQVGIYLEGTGLVPGTLVDIDYSTPHEIDLYYLPDATNGKLELYVDTQLRSSYTGNTLPASVANGEFDGIILEKTNPPAYYNYKFFLSQIILSTESTLGAKLVTRRPDGNGYYTQWNGSFSDIDEKVLDTNDFIYTDTPNNAYTATFANIPTQFSNYDVLYVQLTGWHRNAASSNVNDVQYLLRNSGVDYTTANLNVTKNGAIELKIQGWTTSPFTGNQWTKSEVDGTEFGVKAV